MAVPNNYIDKIKKDGDSRMISPAADMVRVDNDNFEGTDLDEVLDEVAQAIGEAGEGGYAPPAGGIPKTDLASGVQTSLGKADSAIQGVKVNGTELTPDSSKKVDVTVPTKLSDLTADATHRVVTDTEKSTWSGKQSAINDLDTIRSGAGKGATSVQTISVNGGTAQQPTNGVVNLTVATGGDNDLVGLSDGTANDGAVVFTKRNGDTITLDLNHAHPQYQPLLTAGANITIATNQQTGDLEISASGGGSGGVQSSDVATIVKLADQASYEALPTKDSSTLYLIPES